VASAQNLSGFNYGLQGFLACGEDILHLSVWLSDERVGQTIFQETFTGRRDDLLKLVREAALAVMKELPVTARRKDRTPRRNGCPAAGARPIRKSRLRTKRSARRKLRAPSDTLN
jgi:hypothetical protein